MCPLPCKVKIMTFTCGTASSFSTQSNCPACAAQCSGVLPALSTALTGARFSKHSLSRSMFPLRQASCIGLKSATTEASPDTKLAGTRPSLPRHLTKFLCKYLS